MRQITYPSVVFDPDQGALVKQDLIINLYETLNPKSLVVRSPGMSDSPFADEKNPLLQKFVTQSKQNNIMVAVLASPGTAGMGYIEQRTMQGLSKNIIDALQVLKKEIASYDKMKKYLVGRSIGGTLTGGLLNNEDFDNFAIVAGRLETKELYNDVMNNPDEYPPIEINGKIFYGFGGLQEYMQAGVVVENAVGKKLYCQNEEYVKELLTEKAKIEAIFAQVGRGTKKPKLLTIQARDDTTVPYTQLSEWETLAKQNNISVSSLTIETPCGHRFEEEDAVKQTSTALIDFISN